MSEKRKPVLTMMLRFSGKKNVKVDLFSALDYWQKGGISELSDRQWLSLRYRIRADGVWQFGTGAEKSFFTWYEVRDIIWRTLTSIKHQQSYKEPYNSNK